MNNKKLVLQDGSVFEGVGFGSTHKVISELVFNTAMVGYPEVLSDNSYCGQMVCFTYPMIGNYGINQMDMESDKPMVDGLIVKEFCEIPNNHTCEETLNKFLKNNNIGGISGIDTRLLTKQIRDNGTQFACICDIDCDTNEIIEDLNNHIERRDQVAQCSTKRIFQTKGQGHKVVVIDCGVKANIVRELEKRNLDVTVVPHDITYEELMKFNPDGVLLSNGPGDPTDNKDLIELIKKIQPELVIFGICLGHQLISLANGCVVEKLKFGHRGMNHPVKNLLNGKVEITSQNHSYAIIEDTIDQENIMVTHINLLDNSIEGIMHKKYPVFSVQYHPESAPGPVDSEYLFDLFVDKMTEKKGE